MSISKDELLKDPSQVKIKMLVNGGFGVGKTYCAMTFPKWAYAMIEPHGIMTAKTNKHLIANMVYYEVFTPKETEDIALTFTRLENWCAQARKDAMEGKIETVIIDNLSHLSQNRWLFIEKYEKTLTKSGAPDTRGMFGGLSRWLYNFTVMKLLTIPCHVIVNCHEMEETEEDATGKSTKTGQIISRTLGGFRDDAPGLFNASIYLKCFKSGLTYKYQARCLPGEGRNAKNNLGLPEIVEDISYAKIMEAIKQRS